MKIKKKIFSWGIFILNISLTLFFETPSQADNFSIDIEDSLVIFQENTLYSFSPSKKKELINKNPALEILAIVTAYSSTPCQTDEDPHITAAGTIVRDGVVANNFLPFGTKIKIPEIFGEKIFVVEDRMHWRKSNYHFDIWVEKEDDALQFGAKKTFIEILGD